MELVDDVKKEADYNFIDKLISEHFAQKLLSTVEGFYRHKQTKENEGQSEESEEEEDEEESGEEQDYQKMLRRRERERKLKEARRWEFP